METITINKVTRWYGQVIGVNDISFRVGPGVTALLGPNGAGKSTLMKLITGHILPHQGEVRVNGVDPFRDHELKRNIGYMPEVDALPDLLTGRLFLVHRAVLRGYDRKESEEIARRTLERAGLDPDSSKKVGAYSRGMRQRLKLAQAMLHEPGIFILDEPLTGLDPVGRRQVIDLIKSLGEEGRTLLVSSHVLHEVELMTDQVVLILRGKILAEGTIEHIRSLIDSHPHTVEIGVTDPKALAVALLEKGCVVSVSLDERVNLLRITTREPDRFYTALGALIVEGRFEVDRFHSPDNNLQAVFDYLVK